jgi:hypothetical protein
MSVTDIGHQQALATGSCSACPLACAQSKERALRRGCGDSHLSVRTLAEVDKRLEEAIAVGNVTRVLVDTNVLLEDPAVLVRIRQRGGLPFLTGTVLDELDFNKDINKRANRLTNKADAQRAAENARNAQFIFREFNSAASSRLTALPTGEPLVEGDVLTQVGFKRRTRLPRRARRVPIAVEQRRKDHRAGQGLQDGPDNARQGHEGARRSTRR